MKKELKELINNIPIFQPLRTWNKKRRQKRKLVEWERSGRPVPPPDIIKQRTLQSFAKKYMLSILIETGTYNGDMIEAMKENFDQIYSIELSNELYEKAKKKFENEKNIELIQGDSGIALRDLIDRINRPALFWLDGHYSEGITAKGEKDTPIYEELTHIFNSVDRGHVIIIDDAHCFGEDQAYPSIEELSNFIKSNRPDANITVEDDSVRITPNKVSN